MHSRQDTSTDASDSPFGELSPFEKVSSFVQHSPPDGVHGYVVAAGVNGSSAFPTEKRLFTPTRYGPMSIANRPNLAPVSTGGLLLYDPYGCCLLVSDDIPALLGVARGDFIEQKLFDLPLWREIGVTALLERAVRGEFPLQQEIKWQRSGSDLLCFVLHVTQIRIDSLPHLQLQIQEIHEQQDASNEYQATLLQSISDAVIGLDLNLRITEWNRAAASLYGWQAEEVLGRDVNDILKAEYPETKFPASWSEFVQSDTWSSEVVQQHKNGESLQVIASVTPIKDNNGQIVGAVAVNRDITAHKKVEDRLLTLSSAIEQSPVSVLITDATGAIEYVNPKFTQLTGYSLDEVRGRNPRILKSGETSAEEYRKLWEAITSGGQWQGQLHNRAKDGSLFWESALIAPIVDANGKTTHFVAIKEDITERKRREQEQDALLNLAVALRSGNTQDEILPAILQQSAHAVAASMAAYVSYHPESQNLVLKAAYRQGEPIYQVEIPLSAEGGISERVLWSGEPFFSCDGPVDTNFLLRDLINAEQAAACLPLRAYGTSLGVLWVFRADPFSDDDIRLMSAVADMAAVALQRAILHDQVSRHASDLEREVAARTKELAEANERLKELDRLKSKFVSDVTHELRTPVTNIGLYLKLLEHKPTKLGEYLPILSDQTDRLRILVKDTLDLSRMDQNRDKLNIVPVELNALIENIVAAHRARAEEQNLALIFNADTNLPLIKGDHDRLTQVITNLVVNALNYTPNGHVTVETAFDGERRVVSCAVRDTGCGIYFDDIPHLFDRFYRGRRDQMKAVPGTGLGLSIVKEIVEMHGGQIHVTSEVGFGSTFTVLLPLSPESKVG